MDTTKSIYKPLIHEHPLFYTARFKYGCNACPVRGMIYGGYYCNETSCAGSVHFHKECAEVPLEIIINIPSHSQQHPLLLTNGSKTAYTPCGLCGEQLLYNSYSCSACEFNVHLLCGIKPSPLFIEHPLCHDHPLVFLKKRGRNLWKNRDGKDSPCGVCKTPFRTPAYSCLLCNDDVYFHVGCAYLSKEAHHHPCHSNHPLQLIESQALTDDAEKTCILCGPRNLLLYHCSVCNFTTCLDCAKNPPPLVVNDENHKHPLTLFSRRISFTCDARGAEGSKGPYVCLECGYVIHRRCISLPHVININRHDHRISFTHHLGAGYSKCGVCRKDVSRYKGGYSCSVCPNYAVHSICALDFHVWDNVELEWIPDDNNYIASFDVVDDNLISHFSHRKHILRLQKDTIVARDECTRCEACFYPLGFGSIYACEECCFHLHEKCAKLPTMKRFVLDTSQYMLDVVSGTTDYCQSCGIISCGFKYKSQVYNTCVHCASLSEPFVHDGHLHPLYFDLMWTFRTRSCRACNEVRNDIVLRCDACDFDLCFYCASLPLKIWHRHDDEHPLTLSYGIDASDENWCDMCEKGFNPSNWFYACYDCGVMLHTKCGVGDFSRVKLGTLFSFHDYQYEAVANNHSTRPLCRVCHSRCNASIILKERDVYDQPTGYMCSMGCYMRFIDWWYSQGM